MLYFFFIFFFSSRRRHTMSLRDWSSDVCSSDLVAFSRSKAAFDRLNAAVRPLTPARFLSLTDAELLRIGFSRQKTLYTRLLAESLSRRHFDLRYLHDLHDDAARKMLVAFKGIGKWTADIYLLSALRRPDI